MMIKKLILLTILLFLSCSDQSSPQFKLQQAFPNLSFTNPVDLQNAGDGTDRIFVVEQAGAIYLFENNAGVTEKKKFLDITDSVSSGGEMGLLGLAFHPNYENNGYFYVNYTKSSPVRRTLIVRFKVSSQNPDSADRSSSKILMEIVQPYSNHNGGQVAFGPDGYLYIALGDGGSGGDPQNNAQNKSSLLGKLLRIDVDQTQGSLNYAIPSDNPFKNNTQGFKEEIYAYGLRNPWRFSFDIQTGLLWCADVGQNAWEEIDIVNNGGNYGWRCYEGNHTYDMSKCTDTNYIPPIWEYPHSEGISITGGYVYRGPNLPELFGKYIYADFGSKNIWALTYDGINPATNQLLLTASRAITSFGVDINNELYVVTYDGIIYRFTPTASIVAPTNLRFTVNNANSITLNWNDNSDNETGFKIERKVDSGNFVFLETVNENTTTYTDNTVNDTHGYSYRVYAYNSTASSGYSNTTSIVTEVPVELNAIPEKFRLIQNYPNPFNPSTKISYAIPSTDSPLLGGARGGSINVKLKVYDVLGNEIATLVNEEKHAGLHEVLWDSANAPSGVYFCQLRSGNSIDTKKMMLLR
jgi:glucose/arabinose dehydrogenase